MSRRSGAPRSSRREFLAQTGGVLAAAGLPAAADERASAFEPVKIPEWVYDVTRMAFVTPGDLGRAAKAGAQVVHANVVWPYFPLRRDGGGLSEGDARRLRDVVADCRRAGVRCCLGLPPFPPVALVKQHADWRVHPDDSDAAVRQAPDENNLGTRLCRNNGPWGDCLIDVCAELIADYGLDGFSFDGNYHPPLCFCPACKAAYERALPAKADLDDIAYREYLVWRGERLEVHYRRMQAAIKKASADAVLTSWTVNAGRYGHFLYSPRAMPTRLNRLFDLPMQEWRLDETNQGGSLAPSFGAAYLKATVGGRPCASEPYLMSRGNPYGTDGFPAHERRTRVLLSLTYGGVLAGAFSWPGHEEGVADEYPEVQKREIGLERTAPLPWAAMLVSEQTRQFYAYKDIADRWIPHVVGAFRAATEEHLPLTLVNDWDLDADALSRAACASRRGGTAATWSWRCRRWTSMRCSSGSGERGSGKISETACMSPEPPNTLYASPSTISPDNNAELSHCPVRGGAPLKGTVMATIRDILTVKGPHVLSIGPDANVLDAARLMNEHKVGSLLVMSGGRLIGIITERDILQRVVGPCLHPAQTPVHEVMTTEVVCCQPHTPIDEAAGVLKNRRIRHLPVVDDDSRLHGVISIGDLNAYHAHDREMTIHIMQEYIYGRV